MSVFQTPPLSRFVEGLVSFSRDYRTWLASPRPLPVASGLRVALASEIFDVSSRFSCMSAVLELLDRRFERLEAYVQLAVSNREWSSV
jgi:hypothetical protein